MLTYEVPPFTKTLKRKAITTAKVYLINNDISVAMKTKTAQIPQERHLEGLRALREENLIKRFICVCREDRPRRINGILVLPRQEFLQQLWAKELF